MDPPLNHPALQTRLNLEAMLDHRPPPRRRPSARSTPPAARSPSGASRSPPAPTAPPRAPVTPPDEDATAPSFSPAKSSRPARTTPRPPARSSSRPARSTPPSTRRTANTSHTHPTPHRQQAPHRPPRPRLERLDRTLQIRPRRRDQQPTAVRQHQDQLQPPPAAHPPDQLERAALQRMPLPNDPDRRREPIEVGLVSCLPLIS